MLNMVIGETHTISAVDSAGQAVTGLTWTSSDSNIVSLSADDPPVLSALTAGHVTITAGAAAADVIVSAGALPVGTVLWSNPGNGSGVRSLVPAVPSPQGIADIFAFQNDGTVQAITSEGATAWIADVSRAYNWFLADFQGGLIVMPWDGSQHIVKLDGITGQPYPAYTITNDDSELMSVAVHPDGTIFALVMTEPNNQGVVVGIDPITAAQKALMTNADGGIVLSWSLPTDQDPPLAPHLTTISGSGVIDSSGPLIPGQNQCAIAPVLQRTDGSFIGVALIGDRWAPWYELIPYMVAFDGTGNVLWSVANEQPQMATADGGVIGQSGITYDHNGNSTEQANVTTQSWTGNEYSSTGSISSISMPPKFPEPDSFWPQPGGNPSGNGTAFVQCPCLMQSTGSATQMLTDATTGAAVNHATLRPADSGAPLKTYVILSGDPGLSVPGHTSHNVGNLFDLAAATQQDALNALGNLAGPPIRVSSAQDVATQLTGNGPITGGVIYFGHGGAVPYGDGSFTSGLAPGEQAGAGTNITVDNVNLLSNAQLDTGATITLNACQAGFGSRHYSIAQLIANRLQRRVYAPVAGMFFSVDPNSRASGATAPKNLPNQKPIYMLQDGGRPLSAYQPSLRD